MKHISILACTLFLLAVLMPACGQESDSVPAVPATLTQQIVTTPSPTEPASTASETISGHPVLTSSNANALTLLARIGEGMVRQIAYSPDGKDLAVATSIGMFVYSIDTLEEVNSHETDDIVWSIAFSPDGKKVAAGLNDNTILLWDWQGDQISLILGDEYKYNAVNTVAFSPDGSLIAGGYLSGGVGIWNVADGSRLRTLMADTPRIETKSIAFSPDGRFLATGSSDAKTRLWDVSSGTLRFSFGEAENSVSSVAFSPDGTSLASASFSWDSTIRLWKTSDGSMIRAFKGNSLTYSSLSFSPDGRYLSAVGNDRNVEIWRLADDTMVKLPASSSGFAIFSPDSTTLAVVSEITVEFWKVDLNRLASSIETIWAGANCISFSPDSRLLAAGYKDGRVRLWSLNDQSLVRTLSTQTRSVGSIAYSPDGTLLAIGATDGKVQLWDPVAGILKSTLNYDLYNLNPDVFHFRIPTLAFSPDGTILAAGIVDVKNTGNSTGKIILWNVENQEILLEAGTGEWVHSVSFSTDGSYLAIKGGDHVSDFNVNDAIQLNGYPLLFFEENNAFTGSPSTIFSPDGQYLAMAGLDIALYDISNGPVFVAGIGHYEMQVQSLVFSPDGSLLVSGGGDNTLRVWYVSDQSLLTALTGHNLTINSVAWSPDGALLASVSLDGTIRLWGIPDGSLDTSPSIVADTPRPSNTPIASQVITATTASACGAGWTRLHVGNYAVVSPGNPNRVRSEPRKGDNVISVLTPGAIVKLVEGPVCADGLVFWKVSNASIPGGSGWTAEGDGKEYWLEPYTP